MQADLSIPKSMWKAVPEVRPAVSIRNVALAYRTGRSAIPALQDISLDVTPGTFVAIVGPSGCGKSTLLRLVSGLVPPDTGEIHVANRRVQGLVKGIGYMFQQDGLLSWKTVTENIGLPLKLQGYKPAEIAERVADWLRRTGLTRFANAYPSHLSGGMRKRVALAQTLIARPELVMFDEPLSALDVQTRTLVGNDLLALWAKQKSTVMMVTHDLEEAVGMADQVVVLTARPARVKSVYDIRLPRPRDLMEIRLSKEFQELYSAIWSDMREEVLRSHVETQDV